MLMARRWFGAQCGDIWAADRHRNAAEFGDTGSVLRMAPLGSHSDAVYSPCGNFCSSLQMWWCSSGTPRCPPRQKTARSQLKPRKRQELRKERKITKQRWVSKVQSDLSLNHSSHEINLSFQDLPLVMACRKA